MKLFGLILFCSLGFVVPLVTSQVVVSCGGFIKSDFPIDFKRIMVKLLTLEGNLKYETEVAPNNGYYMIPVYNKGDYIIKVHPPQGWIFEPESQEVSLDLDSDLCSKGVDINFQMKGFSVFAKVVSGSSSTGPSGIQVNLVDEKTKNIVTSTKSHEGGSIVFPSVLPGSYELKMGGGSSMCVSHTPLKVMLLSDAVTTEQHLQILGYKLSGTVTESNKGIPDVSILLYGPANLKVLECGTRPVPGFVLPNDVQPDMKFICSTKSDKQGNFQFPCVPTGNFLVFPFLESNGVKFTVTPRHQSVNIIHDAVQIKEKFIVKGFSVAGKVLWGKNDATGVSNAKISVDGRETTVTDEEGAFNLEQVTTGSYSITATAKNAEFDVVKVDLSAKQNKIPNIVANKLNLCGEVSFHHFPSTVPKLTKRTLLLTQKDNAKDTMNIQTDDKGKFCKMVHKGKFVLEPQILPAEKEAGLSVVPVSLNIDLDSHPLLHIRFNQFQAYLSGQIKCLAPCKNVKVFLKSNGKEVKSLLLETNQQLQKYEFKDLLPGIYTVQLESDHFCWDHKTQSISVDKSDASGVDFAQTGFRVDVTSSCDAKLDWSFTETKVVQGSENIAKGRHDFCVPVDGSYQFKLTSCHKFEKEVYDYSTKNPGLVNFFATKHAVRGVVKVKGLTDDIRITIESQLDPKQNIEIGPLKVDDSNATNKMHAIPYGGMALTNDKLIITPTSHLFLFTPKQLKVNVKDDCIIKGMDFVAEKGIFLDGIIEPPIEGVEIVMSSDEDELVFNVVSDKQGKYRIGPLRSLAGFSFSGAKPGYTLVHSPSPSTPGLFKAFKLSELVIRTVDAEKEKLGDVLISLSGGLNYRSNNSTSTEEASIVFVGLSPGEYFIKPILKEYSFEPPSQMVTVEEGSTKNVLLVGRRVAYSCFGQVRHLAGQPAASALVEAVATDCKEVHEEATSDEGGYFRVRGLIPGCTYQLKLVNHPEIQTTLPALYKFKMETADLKGRDLIARPALTTMMVAGRVLADLDYLPSLKVIVARVDEPDAAVYTYAMNIGSMFYIHNIPIDKTNYLIRLSTSLPQSQYQNFPLPEFYFTANSSFWFKELEFKPLKKVLEAEISKASYVALPFFILLIFLFYNHTKVAPFLENVILRVSELMGPDPSKTTVNREPPGQNSGPENISDTFLPPNIDTTARKRVKSRKV